jgi:hypothetical protein
MPLAIYYSATQPTTYQTQRQLIAGGAWANDTTQPASGVVTVSALTYNGTTPGVSYATNHGLTLLTTGAWMYRLVPTYADGSTGLPTLPILPGDQADYECVVTGKLDEQWATGTTNRRVEMRLLAPTNGGNQTYLTRNYESSIDVDGSWQIPGIPLDRPSVWLFPDGSRLPRQTPAESADFTSLQASTDDDPLTITIYRGATFRWAIVYADANGPVDLTGYSARMVGRLSATAETSVFDWRTDSGEITIDGPSGEISVDVSALDTGALSWSGAAVWDIVLTSGAVVERVDGGTAELLEVISA